MKKKQKKLAKPLYKRNQLWLVLGFAGGGLLALSVVVGLAIIIVRASTVSPPDDTSTEPAAVAVSTDPTEKSTVTQAESCSALKTLTDQELDEAESNYLLQRMPSTEEATGDFGMGDAGDEGDGSQEFSTTNVQVEGIDEADVIKNDGEYIYYARKGSVDIARVHPTESIEVLSRVEADHATFYNIYIYEDYLVVLGSLEYGWYGAEEDEVEVADTIATFSAEEQLGAELYWNGGSVVEIWDISEKDAPEFKKGWAFDGTPTATRMTNGDLYLVLRSYAPTYDQAETVIPHFREYGSASQSICGCTDVWIPEEPVNRGYVGVMSWDLDDLTKEMRSEVAYGIGDTLYMSYENIYVAGSYYDYPDSGGRGFFGEIEDFFVEPEVPTEKTVISKFSYKDNVVAYENSTEVPGFLLNQFSMDEYSGNLRLALTEGGWGETTSNSLYVLDGDLEEVGKITGMAEGEQIYSVRFMGQRGYIVTFEQIDPLFVIDLADPTNPTILGELKIPGYSDYLHPWGENYLIGFGMQVSNRYGWPQTEGLKIGLFDVTDPTNPDEVAVIEIGGAGSYSQILYDHKALIYNREAGWFAIPVYEYAEEGGVIIYGPGEEPTWEVTQFQGMYVFDLDVDGGEITLRGRITHHLPTDYADDWSYYDNYWDREIERGLYIGDVLYAISDESIGAYDLATLEEKLVVDWDEEVEVESE